MSNWDGFSKSKYEAMQRGARGPHWVCWRCDVMLDSGEDECPHCESGMYVAHCNGKCVRCTGGVEPATRGVVGSLNYSFASKVGILRLPPDRCADMQSAIALFQRIDRDVSCIAIVAGDVLDTSYLRVNGRWEVQP